MVVFHAITGCAALQKVREAPTFAATCDATFCCETSYDTRVSHEGVTRGHFLSCKMAFSLLMSRFSLMYRGEYIAYLNDLLYRSKITSRILFFC